uniref:Photosystem I reaction center subunit XI n=1 Tax=Lygus hesperus TaxID=30085 RepID=A0A0A9WD33_LYGHE
MMTTYNYSRYVDLTVIDVIAASLITAAVDGLSAHLIRLSKACAINACTFQKTPTILPSGCPITTGPVDLFTILRQSIAGISSEVELRVMRQVSNACADAILAYLDECKQRSDFDY